MIFTTVVFIAKKTYFNIENIRLIKFLALFICSLGHLLALGQNQSAFTLAKKGNNTVVLYKLNSSTNKWKPIGNTGVYNIKSLATDSKNGTIYAVDGGKLGKLNPNTGKFSSIGEIGYGSGQQGFLKINNVYAIAFDANRNILYATHRMDGLDILLQINPRSGKIISGSMINSAGKKADYKTIEIKTFHIGKVFDSKKIIDLAYDNKGKILYFVHNYFSTSHGLNGYINFDKQAPEEYLKLSPIQKLAGIGLNEQGKLFLSFSDNRISTGSTPTGGGVTINFGTLNTIDPSVDRSTFFYGLDFYTAPATPACSSHLQVNGGLTSNATIQAIQTIESSALVYINTKFIAGKSVSLNNNFEVRKSANFEIQIDENVCR